MKKILILGGVLFMFSSCRKECTCEVTYDGDLISTYSYVSYGRFCEASDYEYYDYYTSEGYSVKCK